MDSITEASCLALKAPPHHKTQEKPYNKPNKASVLPTPPSNVRYNNGC
jgi:hypothetical protein